MIILIVLFIPVAIMLVWADYLAIMHLKLKRDEGLVAKMHWFPKSLAYIRLFIFILEDVLFNWIVGTVLFLEIPKEALFTSRVSRLNDATGWRGKLARYFCHEFLDPFDEGGHCK